MPGHKRLVSALQLMVQTPGDLFVYWEVSREFLKIARIGLRDSSAQMVLLLYREESGQTEQAALVPLDQDLFYGSHYFSRQKPWKTYYAELSLSYKGAFFTLLRSNRVLTPPVELGSGEEKPSVPVQWQDVTPKLPFAYSPEEERGDT
ncbi:MAG: hypothetical protein DDT21_00467 [Syntrophomonadaceae bacterium]|nr:hypothetical protein [Bacillota bacterium]